MDRRLNCGNAGPGALCCPALVGGGCPPAHRGSGNGTRRHADETLEGEFRSGGHCAEIVNTQRRTVITAGGVAYPEALTAVMRTSKVDIAGGSPVSWASRAVAGTMRAATPGITIEYD